MIDHTDEASTGCGDRRGPACKAGAHICVSKRSSTLQQPGPVETLAILDGAGGALPGHVIAERLIVSSAGMTSLVDTLQRRSLVERRSHPPDGRKVLIQLTPDGQRIVDQQCRAGRDEFVFVTIAVATSCAARSAGTR
jgi:hypothetical protein